jgi:hypothetical protein
MMLDIDSSDHIRADASKGKGIPLVTSPAAARRKKAKATFQKLTARAPTLRVAFSKKMAEKDQHKAVPNAARAPSFSIGWSISISTDLCHMVWMPIRRQRMNLTLPDLCHTVILRIVSKEGMIWQ